MNYKNVATKARQVVRQSHTPSFQVPESRPRILALYRQIMRYTSKFTTETPGVVQLQDIPGRDQLRFAIWNAFHKNKHVSDQKAIDLLEFEGRFFLEAPLKSVIESQTKQAKDTQVVSQHHYRDIMKRLYYEDHLLEFLNSQGLSPTSELYQEVINDPSFETAPSLKLVRQWKQYLKDKNTPIVKDFNHHKQLLELEKGTCMTAKGLQLMTFCKTKEAMASGPLAKKLIHLKSSKLFPPLVGREYKTKEGSLWTSVWRRTFAALPTVLDMHTFRRLSNLANDIENDKNRFGAQRMQRVLAGIVGIEEDEDGKLNCAVYQPKYCKSLSKDDYLVSRFKRPEEKLKEPEVPKRDRKKEEQQQKKKKKQTQTKTKKKTNKPTNN